MFTRPGYSSPVLRGKEGESIDEFKVRMAKMGWTNLEQVGLHESPEARVYHAGKDKDKCELCLRQQKRTARAKVSSADTKTLVSSQVGDEKIKKSDANQTRMDDRGLDNKMPGHMSRGSMAKFLGVKPTDTAAILEGAQKLGYVADDLTTPKSFGRLDAQTLPKARTKPGKDQPAFGDDKRVEESAAKTVNMLAAETSKTTPVKVDPKPEPPALPKDTSNAVPAPMDVGDKPADKGSNPPVEQASTKPSPSPLANALLARAKKTKTKNSTEE